jgi:hypothetical protein
MRRIGYMIGGLVIVACGETKRDFVTDNALGDLRDASLEASAPGASESSGDEVATRDPSPGVQTGHVPAPEITSDGEAPDAATPPQSDLDASAAPELQGDAEVLPMSQCQTLEYDALSINEPAAFPGVRNIYFYGDGVTTACVTHNQDRLCIEGNAPVSSDGTDDFKNWGMGLGMYLATSVPFDAYSQGIFKVRFALTNVVGRSVRIAITQVPDPNITDESLNYQNNAFVYGGSELNDVASDVTVTAALADFALPAWTHVVDGESAEPAVGLTLNSAQLASLQVQIVNGLDDEARMYSYCVGSLQWLDADGNPVEPVVPGAEPSTESSTESSAE